MHVLTLIAPAGSTALEEERAMDIARALARAGGKVEKTAWLAEGEACDIFFDGLEARAAYTVADAVIADAPIDRIVQTAEGRRKKLLISDMDSTMITCECIDELADFAGLKEKVAAITERAMNGELDFKEALTERVALLAGLPESVLGRAYDERVKPMPGAKELVATMRANGAYLLLVSGGFTFFTSRVRDLLGFHADHANQLEIENGCLTGRVIPPVLDKQAKLESLQSACNAHAVAQHETLAVGDGANDLPMLLAAGLGVAYHAKSVVQEAAAARLNHGDLSALLFVQGYRREEWISHVS